MNFEEAQMIILSNCLKIDSTPPNDETLDRNWRYSGGSARDQPRVHGQKNNAVRLNLAAKFRSALLIGISINEPSRTMFNADHVKAKRPGAVLAVRRRNMYRAYRLPLRINSESASLDWVKWVETFLGSLHRKARGYRSFFSTDMSPTRLN